MKKLRATISKGPEDFGAWIENLPGVYGAGETVAEVRENLAAGRIILNTMKSTAWLKNGMYKLIY